MKQKTPTEKNNAYKLREESDADDATSATHNYQGFSLVLQNTKLIKEEIISQISALEDMLYNIFSGTKIQSDFEHFGIEDRLEEKLELNIFRDGNEYEVKIKNGNSLKPNNASHGVLNLILLA